VEDSQRQEIRQQIDQLTQQISESHYEETRHQIDELYRRLNDLNKDDDAAGASTPR
jgi:hypothetical protein